jgi:L-rhamnose isomerase/sugar isomerase
VQRSYAQALLVDRATLKAAQNDNDALTATQQLRHAFRTDVEPILALARLEAGGAIDPLSAYRASGYRAKVAAVRPAVEGGSGGIV